MCGGGGGGGDAAAEQRKQEEERQQRIEQGKAQLERIFAGLEGNQYRRPETPIYNSSGWDDISGQVSDVLDRYATQRQEVTERREAMPNDPHLYETRKSYSTVTDFQDQGRQKLLDMGFDPKYVQGKQVNENTLRDAYTTMRNDPNSWTRVEDVSAPIWEQQQEAYLDFANPQLDNQYKDARKDLGFALARQGINASSTAGDRWGKLQEDYNLQQQAIADKAMGYANQAKSNIADEKQSLLTMLNSTADPGSAVSAARSAVNSLSSTPSFSPLGPLFQNATAGLAAGMQGNQQFKQNEKLNNIMYGGDPDRGSGKVVGGN